MAEVVGVDRLEDMAEVKEERLDCCLLFFFLFSAPPRTSPPTSDDDILFLCFVFPPEVLLSILYSINNK
jgi:hypothetical protein